MQLALIEYFSAGGEVAGAPSEVEELGAQGAAMLRTVAGQLAQAFTIRCPVGERVAPRLTDGGSAFPAQLDVVAEGDADGLEHKWLGTASRCDAALLIAPESDGILVRLLQSFGDAGIRLLNCDVEFTRCAADKLLTSERLRSCAVATPATLTVNQSRDAAAAAGWIRKPRFGCGSAGIAAANAPEASDDDLFQPFVLGAPVGCAVLVSAAGQCEPLTPLIQKLRPGSFEYQGSDGAVPEELDPPLRDLARRAVAALPGRPRGYVGVDMIVAQDGPPVVLDINPRFTCSVAHLPFKDRERIAATYRTLAGGANAFS